MKHIYLKEEETLINVVSIVTIKKNSGMKNVMNTIKGKKMKVTLVNGATYDINLDMETYEDFLRHPNEVVLAI